MKQTQRLCLGAVEAEKLLLSHMPQTMVICRVKKKKIHTVTIHTFNGADHFKKLPITTRPIKPPGKPINHTDSALIMLKKIWHASGLLGLNPPNVKLK